MISAVLFDIYGTLIDVQTDEAAMDSYVLLSKWLEYSQVYISPDQIKWFYHEEFARRIGPPEQHRGDADVFAGTAGGTSAGGRELFPEADVREVFRTILARCCTAPEPVPGHLPEDLAHLFRAATRRRMFVYPTVRKGLDLVRKGYRLGIVSNAQEAFTLPELDLYGLRPYFETIVLSSQAGVKKPNPAIFRAALDLMKVEPRQAVFVGNDLLADILGAGRLGMKTIYVGRGGQSVRGAVPDATLPDVNFHEIRDVVDGWNAAEKK